MLAINKEIHRKRSEVESYRKITFHDQEKEKRLESDVSRLREQQRSKAENQELNFQNQKFQAE